MTTKEIYEQLDAMALERLANMDKDRATDLLRTVARRYSTIGKHKRAGRILKALELIEGA